MPFRGRGSDVVYGGSHIPVELKLKVDSVLDQFEENIERIAMGRSLKRAVVRSRLPCLTYIFVNSTDMFMVAATTDAITSTVYLPALEEAFTVEDIQREGVLEYGLHNPFAFRFSRRTVDVDSTETDRMEEISQLATQYVDWEVQRMMDEMHLVRVNPIFGTPAYRIQEQSCFVIGPFAESQSAIYRSIIKPTVTELGLSCHRADELFTNRAIMEDIWRSICSARVIIADLTDRNANVFYELGIAHTLGKETILLSKRDSERIPFDIQGIRQIRFEDSPSGGIELRRQLKATLEAVLRPPVVT